MSKRTRPHYYLKIAADSEVGKKLQAFVGECTDAQEKARLWAEKQGADSYYESPNGFAGGVAMVEFKNTITKEGWKNVKIPRPQGEESTPYFVPNPNSDLEKEMMALPIVNEAKLIGILEFKPVVVKGKDGKDVMLPFSFGNVAPALFLHHGYWYTDVPYQSNNADCVLTDEKEFLRRRMANINEVE